MRHMRCESVLGRKESVDVGFLMSRNQAADTFATREFSVFVAVRITEKF